MLTEPSPRAARSVIQPARPALYKASAGFSLIELMISITVGLIVMSGVLGIFANSVRSSADALKAMRLNQEMSATMDMITRDVRRSGYWGLASSAIGPPATSASNTNPFDIIYTSNHASEAADSCITYSYDANSNGATPIPAAELFGFRLRDTAVQSRAQGAACTDDANWEDITDKNVTQITRLQFTRTTPRIIDIDGVGAKHSKIKISEVKITLEGRLKNDSQVTRKLVETVRIRSDQWTDS